MPAAARPAQPHSHPHAGGQAGSKPKLYNPRHPQRSLLYRTVAEHFETWLELASAGQFDGQGDHLTPLELIDRIAALVPPPRTHRHRYFGVLAPNSPLRAAVTAMAQVRPAQIESVQIESATTGEGAPGLAPQGNAVQAQAETVPPKRSPAHYLWAVLIARIYEVFPLLCPMCGGQMRLIAFNYRGCADQADPRSHRCRLTAPAHLPGTRATAVGWL